MRLLGLLILALLFGATPFFLFNTAIIPQLTELEQTYDRIDEVAARVAQ